MKLPPQIMKRSSFIYEENRVFIKENNPSDKRCSVEEELNAGEVDAKGNLVDLLRLMFTD